MNLDPALTSKQGFNNQLRASGDFNTCYGIGLHGLFKPFTTKTSATGVAHYKGIGVIQTTNPTGVFHNGSVGLNPIGRNTLFEGIVHGDTLSGDLEADIPDKNNARLYGLKNPAHLVGWGFDTFGYPAPNANAQWAGSGAVLSTQPPSGLFKSTSGNVVSGNLVAHTEWLSGPLDLRWDQHRGVWGGWHGGVLAGKVTNITISGDTYSTSGTYFSETVRYDVALRDGISNQMTLTGVIHIGPKPVPSSYKIIPLSVGQFCFIVHTEENNIPKYAAWMIEPPGVEACSGIGSIVGATGVGLDAPDIYLGAGDGSPANSTKLLTGSGLYHGLRIYPLPISMGGLGLSSVSSGQILIGSTGNNFVARNLIAGSGLQFAYSGTDAVLALSTGTAFISAGTNNNITQLNGLTTPLSVNQGGTGASGIIYVTLSGAQSIQGLKSFHNGMECATGSVAIPGLRFLNTTYGISYLSSGLNGVPSLVIATTGLGQLYFTSSGIRSKQRLHIYNDISDGHDAPLIIQEHNNVGATGIIGGSGRTIVTASDLIQWKRSDGTTIGVVTNSGYLKSAYFHSTGIYTSDSPFLAEMAASPTQPSFKVRHGGNTQLQFDPSGDTLRMNMGKTTLGYIKFAGPSGSSVGYLDMSATNSFAGGYINMSAGASGAGGYLNSSNGGGGIDTYNGTIDLGPSGNRISLTKPSLSTNLSMTLPSSGSIMTTKEYVDAKFNGVVAGGGGFPSNGLNTTIKVYGNEVSSGNLLYTLSFTSGLLTALSAITVSIG